MGGNGNQIIHNAFVRNGNGNSSWEWEGMGMKKAFPATSTFDLLKDDGAYLPALRST
jgi:hypothetical protein